MLGKPGQHEAGVLHEGRRAVHVRLGDHRRQERDVVDAGRQVRHEIADPAAALAVLPPFPGAGHHRAGLALEQLDLAARIELLAVPLDQRRLVVERVALAGRARHEELNDALGPGAVMQPAVELGPGPQRFSRRRIGQERFGPHQVGQRQRAETAAGVPREMRLRPMPERRSLRMPANWSCSCDQFGASRFASVIRRIRAQRGSVDEDELVGVPEQAAGVGQAVLGRVGGEGVALVVAGLAAQGEAIGGDDPARGGHRRFASSRRANSCDCRTMNRSFQSASACSAVSVWLRTGVFRFGSAQSSASMNGLGTLRTLKR